MRPQAEIVRELWDREQIREVIARYCRAVDRAMVEDGRAVYFDDATEDHGVYRGAGRGFISFLTELLTDQYIGHHCLGQTVIDLSVDTAHCETYFICGMAWNREGAPLEFADVRGRYVDTLERRDDDWRIVSRVAVLDLTVQQPMDREWDIADAFVRGQRYPDDLVYHPSRLRARVESPTRASTGESAAQ
jgi:hypothetical protein